MPASLPPLVAKPPRGSPHQLRRSCGVLAARLRRAARADRAGLASTRCALVGAVVREGGFEPPASCSLGRRSPQAELHTDDGAPPCSALSSRFERETPASDTDVIPFHYESSFHRKLVGRLALARRAGHSRARVSRTVVRGASTGTRTQFSALRERRIATYASEAGRGSTFASPRDDWHFEEIGVFVRDSGAQGGNRTRTAPVPGESTSFVLQGHTLHSCRRLVGR